MKLGVLLFMDHPVLYQTRPNKDSTLGPTYVVIPERQ